MSKSILEINDFSLMLAVLECLLARREGSVENEETSDP